MGDFMKFNLFIIATLFTQITFAQTLREQKVKKEMLERVEVLIEKVEQTRQEIDHDNIPNACKLIKEMFDLFPDHLKGIGGHLNFDKRKTIKAKDFALSELIFMHKHSLICDQGKDHEYIDPSELDKDLKKIRRELKKQRRIIKRSDTGFENTFYYRYEF
jgi:hypothetical protein